MKIGVDVRSLSEPITGIGRYTLELLTLMVERGHDWIFYSPRPLLNGKWNKENITIKTNNVPKRFGLGILWTQSVLPLLAYNDGLDLLWGPAHRLPYFMPKSIARVVTIHDLIWRHAPETMRKPGLLLDSMLMPRSVMIADKVIAVSQSTANNLVVAMPEAQNKTVVIHEASLPLANMNNNFQLNSIGINKPFILFIGTLEPRKNLKRLLEAYSRLPEALKDEYLLVIAGSKGWGNENIRDIIKQLRLENNVNILGYVSDEQLACLYQHAQLFVMPSIYEGFGLPLLEAMSFATPVLTSNISSMPEIVGDAGFLVDPYSINSIRKGIEKILFDASLRTRLGQQGRERAQTFSWQKAAGETLVLFEQVMLQRRSD